MCSLRLVGCGSQFEPDNKGFLEYSLAGSSDLPAGYPAKPGQTRPCRMSVHANLTVAAAYGWSDLAGSSGAGLGHGFLGSHIAIK